MSRKLVYNIILLLFLNGIIKPAYLFFVEIGFMKELGDIQYGVFFTLWNIATMLSIILDVGISYFNTHNISQNNQLLVKHFSSLVSLRLILAVIYMLVLLLVSILLGHQHVLFYVFLIGVNQILLSFTLFFRSNLSALQCFKQDSFLSVLDKLLLLLLGVLVLYVISYKISLTIFILLNSLAYLLTCIVAFVLVFRKIKFFHLKLNKLFFISIMKKSLPYASMVLLMGIYYRLDTIMIYNMIENGYEMSGKYGQAYRVYEAFSIYGYMFGALLLPMFSQMIKSKESINSLLSLSFKLAVGGGLFIASILILFKVQLFGFLFDQVDQSVLNVFFYLMLSFVALCSTYIFGTLITAKQKIKWILKISLLALSINFTLNLILIPLIGIVGASIASFITQLCVSFIQINFTSKLFKFNNYHLSIKFFIQLLFSAIIIFIVENNNFSISTLILFSILLLVIFVLSGMLPFKKILILLKTKV